MSKTKKTILFSIVSISALGILAKACGLLREGVIAACFGTSSQIDVFGLITGYVTTIITIVASSLAVSYYPYYIRNLQQKGEREASLQFSHIINQYFLFSVIFFVFILFCTSFIAHYISDKTPGIDYNSVYWTTCVIFSTVITGGMTRLFVTALNGLRKYGWMQITQILYSLICTVLVVIFGSKYGIYILVFAFVLNSVLQVSILWYVYFKGERCYRLELQFNNSETLNSWKTIIPVFLGTETYMLGLTIDRTLGLSLGIEGAAAALNYAGILFGLINMVVSGPISTVFCTEMYRNYYKTEQRDVLFENLGKIINHQAFILIPLGVFLFITVEDFVTVVLKRGAFNEQSVIMTASAFCMYALGAPLNAMRGLFSGVHIALNDRTIPMRSGIIFLLVNFFMSWWLSKIWGISGITVGALLAMLLAATYQLRMLIKKYAFSLHYFSKSFCKIVMASVCSAFVVYLIQFSWSGLSVYIRFILNSIVFGSIYVLASHILHCDEFELIKNRLMIRYKKE